MHLNLTVYSKRIHRPVKILYGYLVRADDGTEKIPEKILEKNNKVKQIKTKPKPRVLLRIRVKFAWIISVLHTNNKFGITYGTCGLVTMTTFAKFVILFFKFLLTTYKMTKRKQ